MKILSLVWSEIAHRRLNFVIGLSIVAIAVASSIGVMTLIHSHRLQTEVRMEAMRKDIIKITKDLGFNITILPADQNLAHFYDRQFAQKTMPYSHVEKLADSEFVKSVNHLRPALIQKVEWTEKSRNIILMGVSGIVHFSHRDRKKPLTEPVPPGTINLGNTLAEQIQLKPGDPVTLRGETFTVGKVYPQRGNQDDITAWIDLPKAQEMLNLKNEINVIQALECNCASPDRLADIQKEISSVLGEDVQVIEQATKAIARAKTRNKVKEEGQASVARIERLASILLPLVIVGACFLVGLMSLLNVRERRTEIGILRAVGTPGGQILALFFTKAALLGGLGAMFGYAIGFAAAVWVASGATDAVGAGALFMPQWAVIVIVLGPLLAIVASWLPATIAAGQDPAVVLREE